MNNIQVLGVYWDAQKPGLFYRKDSDSVRENSVDLVRGLKIEIKFHQERKCVGYWDSKLEKKILCPFGNIVRHNDGKCYLCKSKEVSNYTFTGKSFIYSGTFYTGSRIRR